MFLNLDYVRFGYESNPIPPELRVLMTRLHASTDCGISLNYLILSPRLIHRFYIRWHSSHGWSYDYQMRIETKHPLTFQTAKTSVPTCINQLKEVLSNQNISLKKRAFGLKMGPFSYIYQHPLLPLEYLTAKGMGEMEQRVGPELALDVLCNFALSCCSLKSLHNKR